MLLSITSVKYNNNANMHKTNLISSGPEPCQKQEGMEEATTPLNVMRVNNAQPEKDDQGSTKLPQGMLPMLLR